MYEVGDKVWYYDFGEWYAGVIVNAYPDSVHVRKGGGGDQLFEPEHVKPRN